MILLDASREADEWSTAGLALVTAAVALGLHLPLRPRRRGRRASLHVLKRPCSCERERDASCKGGMDQGSTRDASAPAERPTGAVASAAPRSRRRSRDLG